MHEDDTFKIGSPLTVVFSSERCWKCREAQTVIALAVHYPLEAGDPPRNATDYPSLICEVTELPASLIALINSVHPPYRRHLSKTRGASYFANFCVCGANFGDFYLFMEPGGAFFPMDETEASKITIKELSFPKPLTVSGTVRYGAENLIFSHAKRL